MIFEIRTLKEEDYKDLLVGWWKDWGWQPPKQNFLPMNGTGGFLISDKGTPICAGFIYNTNSSVAWIDWIISNKNYRKKPERKEALQLLINTLTNVAENMSCKYMYALIKHPGLMDIYESSGYTKGESYTQEMIKIL